MKALILENKVCDITNETYEVHSSMQWVDCDETVQVGFDYVDGVFEHFDKRTDAQKAEDALKALRQGGLEMGLPGSEAPAFRTMAPLPSVTIAYPLARVF